MAFSSRKFNALKKEKSTAKNNLIIHMKSNKIILKQGKINLHFCIDEKISHCHHNLRRMCHICWLNTHPLRTDYILRRWSHPSDGYPASPFATLKKKLIIFFIWILQSNPQSGLKDFSYLTLFPWSGSHCDTRCSFPFIHGMVLTLSNLWGIESKLEELFCDCFLWKRFPIKQAGLTKYGFCPIEVHGQ